MMPPGLNLLRSWFRAPRLTLAILACIAISIGGASTVLTFVHSLLLRPLPFPEADRLVFLQPRGGGPSPGNRPYLSYPDFADLRASLRSFETLDAAMVSRLVVETRNGAERLRGEAVTPGYFDAFGVHPLLGRSFTAEEYEGRGARAIIISSRLWRAHFASAEELLGRAVQTRSGPAIVVGVMPEGYLGVAEDEGTDYWLAERQTNHASMLSTRGDPTTFVFGRLAPGVSAAAAEAEVSAVLARLARAHPTTNQTLSAAVAPFGEKWRADLRPGLLTMLVASLFLLAIGCGNVAILLLARLVTREREVAIRRALGASQTDLVRLMAGEGLALALVGGALGVPISLWLTLLFRQAAGIALPTHLPIGFGLGPLSLCLALVAATGVAFSLLPALVARRVHSSLALRAGGRSLAEGALQGRSGRLLVIGQTALAVVLLCGAAMFLRSYDRLRFMDMGFRTENLLRYQVSLQPDRYASIEAVEGFYAQLATDLGQLPGVRQAGYLGPTLPPYDADLVRVGVRGEALADRGGALEVNRHFATTEALSVLRVPLVEGRLFDPGDRRGGRPVGLISQTLAHRLAPGGSALGRVLVVNEDTEVEVVGVVRDARWNGQRDRHPSGLNLFMSLAQFPQSSVGVVFDCAIEPRSLIEPVRRAVVRLDPSAALHWIDTMDEALDFQTAGERFWTMLAGTYAITAFLLAAFGLYGILTHGVVSRTREIGVRMALGASARQVARFVAAQGLGLVGLGLAAGLGLSMVLGRFIESRLYETSGSDPLSLALVSAALLTSGAVVAWLPARRAARLSPTIALRTE